MILVVIAALVVSGVAIGIGVRERLRGDTRISSVRLLADGSAVSGATSTLSRNDDSVDFSLTTLGMPVGHIITLKAEIFNNPGKCKGGTSGRQCGEGDLTNPEVDGIPVYLRGLYYRQTAAALAFNGQLAANDVTHAVSGKGLTNPKGAAVHLIVIDHGVPIPNLYGEMLQTIGAGCANAPACFGKPRPKYRTRRPDLGARIETNVLVQLRIACVAGQVVGASTTRGP